MSVDKSLQLQESAAEGLALGDSPEDMELYQAISEQVNRTSANLVQPAKQRPTFSALVCAIRKLLLPHFNADQTPDLLDLLTAIETYRKFAITRAKDALTFNTYFSQSKPRGNVLLTAEEEEAIQQFISDDDTLRDMYFCLLQRFSQLDIYRLWTNENPSIAQLAVRMNQYYPSKDYGHGPTLRFHRDLSETERESMNEASQNIATFLQVSYDWVRDRQTPNVCRSNEFVQLFCIDNIEGAIRSAETYISYVEDHILRFRDILKS